MVFYMYGIVLLIGSITINFVNRLRSAYNNITSVTSDQLYG